MKIIVIVKEDIRLFPPVQTVILTLLELGHEVEVIGHYSDGLQLESMQKAGVRFHDSGFYDVRGSKLDKLKGNLRFRKRVNEILDGLDLPDENYYLWIFQGLTISLLHDLVEKHPCILHPLEFVGKTVKPFYRMLSPLYDAEKTYAAAAKVINCEYNRAHILKGLLNLEKMPYVLPNKMLVDEAELANPPEEIKRKVEKIKAKVEGKKVILYQGIFERGERRLDEFCEALDILGSEYVMLVMGMSDQEGYRELQTKYPRANILFIPFINPPYHLLITSLASVGVLTYFPRPASLATVINPLYCAPNKIFEYGRYGIPMIGNDIPGLHYIFREYKCGETVGYPMTQENVKEAIERIFADYDTYSQGARRYYDSVDVKKIISDILK